MPSPFSEMYACLADRKGKIAYASTYEGQESWKALERQILTPRPNTPKWIQNLLMVPGYYAGKNPLEGRQYLLVGLLSNGITTIVKSSTNPAKDATKLEGTVKDWNTERKIHETGSINTALRSGNPEAIQAAIANQLTIQEKTEHSTPLAMQRTKEELFRGSTRVLTPQETQADDRALQHRRMNRQGKLLQLAGVGVGMIGFAVTKSTQDFRWFAVAALVALASTVAGGVRKLQGPRLHPDPFQKVVTSKPPKVNQPSP